MIDVHEPLGGVARTRGTQVGGSHYWQIRTALGHIFVRPKRRRRPLAHPPAGYPRVTTRYPNRGSSDRGRHQYRSSGTCSRWCVWLRYNTANRNKAVPLATRDRSVQRARPVTRVFAAQRDLLKYRASAADGVMGFDENMNSMFEQFTPMR